MSDPLEAAEHRLEPVTPDTAWWFEACGDRRLLIQRCTGCHRLRHPARPMCPDCRSTGWDTVEASGRAVVYSAVTVYRPRVPGLEYPAVVGLLELVEGTRVVAGLTGAGPDDDVIGLPARLEWPDVPASRMLPAFRVQGPAC